MQHYCHQVGKPEDFGLLMWSPWSQLNRDVLEEHEGMVYEGGVVLGSLLGSLSDFSKLSTRTQTYYGERECLIQSLDGSLSCVPSPGACVHCCIDN